MKRIAVIAFAVALGLAWTGAAIPADVKQETKEKAKDTKETLKDTCETAKDKAKSAGEKVKDTGVQAKDKAVEWKDKAKEKISGDKAQEGPAKASTQVRSAQQALMDKGYNPGPVDGLMGPRTKAAVTDFQRKEGLEANGSLDMQTMSRLGAQARASEVPSTNPPSATPSASPPTQPGGSKSQKP